MMSRKTTVVLAATASLVIGAATVAQQSGQGRSGSSDQGRQRGRQIDQQISQLLDQIAQDPKTAADKLFLLNAAIHTQAEIELAREVAQKSQNEQVKKMAQNLVQQLKQTNDQLQQTARSLGLQLPQELAQAAVQEVQIVAALPGDQIDRQYTAQVQADNAQDVSQYQSESQIAQDPQVKRFAQDQVRGAQQRTRDANQTAEGMGMRGGEEAQPAAGTVKGNAGGGNESQSK